MGSSIINVPVSSLLSYYTQSSSTLFMFTHDPVYPVVRYTSRVVSGTLDMTPCFLDMLHVGGIWHIGHDIILLACVSLVIRTWCFVLALQLPTSPCLYCPNTRSHLPHCSRSHMIRCILLSDIPHVLVVSGSLDMTPCFLDMLHVGGIWHIGHDNMLLTCVSLLIRTWCFVSFQIVSLTAPFIIHSILVKTYFMVSLLSRQPHMLVDSGTFDLSADFPRLVFCYPITLIHLPRCSMS